MVPEHEIPPILALSLLRPQGWALRHPSGIVTTGVVDFDSRLGERHGLRYVRFERWLQEFDRRPGGVPVVRFLIEDVQGLRAHAISYGSYVGVLTCWAEKGGKDYGGYHTGSVLDHALAGRGSRESESDLIRAAVARGHHRDRPYTLSEARAVHLLHYSLNAR